MRLQELLWYETGDRGMFPAQEKKLYEMYKQRRHKGMPVHYKWLTAKMLILMRIEKPRKYDPNKHKFTNSWCARFCKRWNISRRRRTNTKKRDLFERLHLIRNYHWWIQYQFANPKNWPKYWNRDNLPPLPESASSSESEEVSVSSESESVSDSSWESNTDSSETPSNISRDSHLHSSSEESSSSE